MYQNINGLKLLIKYNAPLTKKTIQATAKVGNTECYDILRKKYCPDDDLTMIKAIENDQYNFVTHLCRNDVEINQRILNIAFKSSRRCFKYLQIVYERRLKFYFGDGEYDV